MKGKDVQVTHQALLAASEVYHHTEQMLVTS